VVGPTGKNQDCVDRLGLDKPVRVVLAVLLLGYCSGVMLSRWVRGTLDGLNQTTRDEL
jgi:hypothetical protein